MARSRAWTPGKRRWVVAPAFEEAGDWARKIGASPLVPQVLHNRGVRSTDEARGFLNPKLTDLHDPSLLAGAEEAGRLLARAAAAGEKIVLYGDYDVDGMTGLAILHGCLKLLGCQSDFYVPHRLEEGYGVNAAAVRKIVESGARMIVTVDCGISDGDALAEATAAGVSVIVTDHHGLPERLPAAAAIVHPALGENPNRNLCGAGVAFKLAWAVARRIGGEAKVSQPVREFLVEAVTLAALGTIADVVPLLGENRVIASFGLKGLAGTKNAGLRALLAAAGLAERQTLEADDVGFALAPRLNASGRMGHARQAVALLLGEDPDRCRQIAEHLCKLNEERQEIERQISEEAAEMVLASRLDAPGNSVIVLSSDRWHEGVIGIVAGRLAERFHRPAVLLAVHEDGMAHGSCRSIAGLDMRAALAACAMHLEGFGGHAMAGGLRIARAKIGAFSAALAEHARANLKKEDMAASIDIDAQTTLAALGYSTVESLGKLAPFGQGNPPPVVAVEGCKVLNEPRRMGRSGQALALYLGQNGASLRAVGFGMGDLADRLPVGTIISIAGEPNINRFNGAARVELRLVDVQLA